MHEHDPSVGTISSLCPFTSGLRPALMLLRCPMEWNGSRRPRNMNKNIQLGGQPHVVAAPSPEFPRRFGSDPASERGRRLVSDAAWDPRDHECSVISLAPAWWCWNRKKVSVGACVVKHHVLRSERTRRRETMGEFGRFRTNIYFRFRLFQEFFHTSISDLYSLIKKNR
jgi:hypothetical protein